MTDKQIIIDGVDVSECIYYDANADKESYFLHDCKKEHAPCWSCSSMPSCLYKKYKRKEQECKEKSWEIGNLGYKIKNQRKEINIHLEQFNQLKAENDELKKQVDITQMFLDACNNSCEHYKQTLTEIKEIAENAAKCLYVTKSDDYTDGYRWLGSIILQKISEVENDNR